MNNFNDYKKYAISSGLNGNKIDAYNNKVVNRIISPSIIEERQLNAVTMDVYSRLIMDRIIILGTEIDSDVANIIMSQMMYLNSIDDTSDIKLYINSPGGECIAGLGIYDIMNWVKCDVATYTMGIAASMASILLAAGERGKRHAMPHSKILIHQPMSGLAPGTQESDFAIAYNELKDCKQTLYEILSEATGKTIEEIEKDADRDHWLKPVEALPGVYGEFGLIDQVISKKK